MSILISINLNIKKIVVIFLTKPTATIKNIRYIVYTLYIKHDSKRSNYDLLKVFNLVSEVNIYPKNIKPLTLFYVVIFLINYYFLKIYRQV